ncbi:WbuC family cupin fold metalloprotein [Bacteroidales bacterium OttesenSCG-928-L14]|nr:WbuC family cupin fold metalloprotein [Bacteroidales bacterium OttesenSCG-928-L14]
MQLIDKQLLEKLNEQANDSSRLRMNYNFHDSLNAPAQRLLNALQIGTILPIHRHCHTAETYILLQGKLKVIFYNDNKEISESIILDLLSGNFGVHIPAGQWHTIEVLESDSVIFEVKDGPYMPIESQDIL